MFTTAVTVGKATELATGHNKYIYNSVEQITVKQGLRESSIGTVTVTKYSLVLYSAEDAR